MVYSRLLLSIGSILNEWKSNLVPEMYGSLISGSLNKNSHIKKNAQEQLKELLQGLNEDFSLPYNILEGELLGALKSQSVEDSKYINIFNLLTLIVGLLKGKLHKIIEIGLKVNLYLILVLKCLQ